MSTQSWSADPRPMLRPGPDLDLAALDRGATPGWDAGKDAAQDFMADRGRLLSELQERLFAHGRTGGDRAVLLVVQGLDTAGKGGIVRHVIGMVDPQGVDLHAFGVPTPEERRHHYLWRVRRALPRPGQIGVFDRSHYEDVLVARVDELVEESVWSGRYAEINRFERQVVDGGTTVVKVALLVSRDEQGVRLMERLDRPDKRWKWNPGDVDTRAQWDAYQQAYADVFARTSTDLAPWHVVPADKKWYARLVVTELLTQALIDLRLDWPRPRWRVDAQKRRLAATMSDDALAAAEQAAAEALSEVAQAEEEFDEAVARAASLGEQPGSEDAAGENARARAAATGADGDGVRAGAAATVTPAEASDDGVSAGTSRGDAPGDAAREASAAARAPEVGEAGRDGKKSKKKHGKKDRADQDRAGIDATAKRVTTDATAKSSAAKKGAKKSRKKDGKSSSKKRRS